MTLRIAILALFVTVAFFHCATPENGAGQEATTEVTDPSNDSLLAKLSSHSQAAQKALGGALMKAIQENGPAGAVSFCNHAALPITDSIAQLEGVIISRVSDQHRNPQNAAEAADMDYIMAAKARLSKGEQALPEIVEVDGKKIGYAPIVTNALCLNCHGTPGEDIAPETLAVLDSLYPEDKAKGYAVNQLRGAWRVEF